MKEETLVSIPAAKLDEISIALGRVVELDAALQALQTEHAKLKELYGAAPNRSFLIPGSRTWENAGSRGDSDEMAIGFLHWVRCIAGKNKVYSDTPDFVKKALSEGTASAGGYLVPDIFIPELLRIIELRLGMRSLVRTIPMTTDTSKLPSLVSGMTVNWPGELQTITQSDAVFGEVTLNAKTMAALTSTSMELEEDIQIQLAQLLAQLFGEAIADEEDKQILVASAAPFTGLLAAASVNQVTMGAGMTAFANLSFNDILDLIDSVSAAAQAGAMFFLHKNVTTIVRKIRDLNHNYIWSPPASPGTPATIWGYPYKESDQMPAAGASGVSKNFIGFGNPKYIFLGDRRQIVISRSTEAGFKNNEVFFKVTERIAVKVALPQALARLRTAAS